MSVKYTIPFRDDANILWRVDIDLPNYIGNPVELVGVGRTFCSLDYGSSNEDPYEAIVNSNVTISFYNVNGEIDVRELQFLSDMEGRLSLYRDGQLEWTGYILPDGIQRLMQPNPYSVFITATDGLNLLENVDFIGINNWAVGSGISNRSPLAFVREVLFRDVHQIYRCLCGG